MTGWNTVGDVEGDVHQSRDHITLGDTTNYDIRADNVVNHFHEVRRRRREARLVADDHVRWLAERFVPPGRFPWHALAAPGTVVLTGPDGAGLRTAAFMLLTGNGETGLTELRELADRTEDDEPALDPAEIAEDERLLLDLTATEPDRVDRMRPELEAYRAEVATRRARLVVVVREDQRHLLADSLADLVKPVDPPPGDLVLKAHLRLGEFEVPADVRDHLAAASPREVAALARLALEARTADPDGTVAEWLRAATSAQVRRDAEAAELFQKHQEGSARALAVVAAFLSGAPLEALVQGEAAFRRLVELPGDDTHALDGDYLAERMTRVGLRTGGTRSVAFTSLGLDSAVRTHFWTYFPDLRQRMPDWVRAAVALRDVDDRTAADLVARFAEQALATGRVDLLTGLAQRWGSGARPDLALRVLTTGLEHPRWSWAFRKHVYHRSRAVDLSPGYAQVLITACAVGIAPSWPTQALVRLHNLTRHHDDEVRVEARQALLDLVHRRKFQRRLLHRLTERGLRPEDHAILYDLDVPPYLAQGHLTRRTLITAWEQVLAAGADVPPHALHRWLVQDPGLLVAACAGRPRLLDHLYLAARASGDAARLRPLIDSALGLIHLEDHR
ncbi:hypothetical protein [Saccharothrix sp. NRRL B-16314]|uniref:hypothetical protein n=1 Tax=Saccharothrix sp. NRRL B-16314 TaxID=1463825 RepID=UPI000526B250|nr:hypothetical protein [Saccharothrix sp. NRRL B-16314]